MMSHQRAGINANKKIETYLIDEFGKPHDFQSFLYMNQLLQGEAIKMAIEAHRRDMPFCMGTLFWQHNDCWCFVVKPRLLWTLESATLFCARCF